VHLKGVVEQSSAREGTIVSLNLRLPSGQMAVQQSAPTPVAAVKAAFDDLLQQITRHKDLLRSSHKWRRRRAENGRPERQVPFEQTLAAVQPSTVSSDDIRSYVNVNLSRLERFVERELYFREVAGEVAPDFVSKEEVVDEVIARALGDGGEKPERLALEPWLYRLAIRALGDLSVRSEESLSAIPLEVSARKQNVRASDEPELQFHQPDEMLTEESIIADRRTATPEDIASSDEMISLVQYALNGAQRPDREVFILHTIEGFSVEEISEITDRRHDEIRSSILAARDHLRRSAPIAHRFREKFLQDTGTD
jgi:DNA-directed RNA polymerase specialized sigma24 family protein